MWIFFSVAEKLRTDGWIGVRDDIGDESFTYLDDPTPVSSTQSGEPFTQSMDSPYHVSKVNPLANEMNPLPSVILKPMS